MMINVKFNNLTEKGGMEMTGSKWSLVEWELLVSVEKVNVHIYEYTEESVWEEDDWHYQQFWWSMSNYCQRIGGKRPKSAVKAS